MGKKIGKWTIASAVFGIFVSIGAPIISMVLGNKASKETEEEESKALQQMVSAEINTQLQQLLKDATDGT